MNVCVFCASSDRVAQPYHEIAEELGTLLGKAGDTLVYGGGSVGLMGTLARAVHSAGGRVIGYIPEKLQAIEGRAYDVADELHVTTTMSERKQGMYGSADAFVILPGGIGTLEEFFEVLTLRKLRYHSNEIVLLNTGGFFAPLVALLEHVDRLGFSPGISTDGTFRLAPDPSAALAYARLGL